MGELLHKFDHYQATVPAHAELLIARLLDAIPGAVRADRKGKFNYLHTAELTPPGDETVCRVFHGGPNGHPNASSTGERGPFLAQFLRATFPEHRVTTCHVAVDLHGEGIFQSVIELMKKLAAEYRMDLRWIGNNSANKGWTYYLGAHGADLYLCVYEKGKQMFSHREDASWRMFEHWVRLELRCRPKKAFRLVASTMEPVSFWGCSAWSRTIAEEVLNMNAQPLRMKPTRAPDHERAMLALRSQYGRHMLEDMKQFTTPEEWGRYMYERLTSTGEWKDRKHERPAAN